MAVNVLLSYAFHEHTNLRTVRSDLVCGRLMIDSGAFTAHTKGKVISLDAYAEFLERWRDCWDHAITLDVIGDGKASARNTGKLHRRGLPVMPVFTRGDSLADFDAMVRDVGYVCVGGLVGLPAKAQRARVGMLQRRAQAAGGGIHALGIGSMATLRATRPYSADASSVSGAFRFGTVVYFDGREIRNVALSDRAKLTRDRNHLRAHGVDLAQLATTGRMPSRDGGRQKLMQAMSLAYACADEVLKHTGPVPPPRSDQAGTHLYASIAKDTADVYAVGRLDRQLHGPHLYQAVLGSGSGHGMDNARDVTELDTKLHAGTHLYQAATGSSSNGHGLKHARDVTALDGKLHAGTHLYNSITPGFALAPSAGLDRDLHQPEYELPSVWRVYGRTHQCRAVQRTTPLPEENPEAQRAAN